MTCGIEKLYFICGNGRSGTTWLGKELSEKTGAYLVDESHNVFYKSRALALNNTLQAEYLPFLFRYYKQKKRKLVGKDIIDKSHTNLWQIESLLHEIQDSRAILLYRNPFDTISSMLLHWKVLQPVKEWIKYPLPNKFLGVDVVCDIATYQSYSLIQKCAIRWCSHYNEISRLSGLSSSKIITLNYDNLQYTKLPRLLNTSYVVESSTFRETSIGKSKGHLTKNQIKQIREVVSKYTNYLSEHKDFVEKLNFNL